MGFPKQGTRLIVYLAVSPQQMENTMQQLIALQREQQWSGIWVINRIYAVDDSSGPALGAFGHKDQYTIFVTVTIYSGQIQDFLATIIGRAGVSPSDSSSHNLVSATEGNGP